MGQQAVREGRHSSYSGIFGNELATRYSRSDKFWILPMRLSQKDLSQHVSDSATTQGQHSDRHQSTRAWNGENALEWVHSYEVEDRRHLNEVILFN